MSRRPLPSDIAADFTALRAIEEMPDYQPSNQTHNLQLLQLMESTLLASMEAKTQMRIAYERAQRAYQQACLVESETARRFRDLMRAAKIEVLAQYGEDSFAVQAIGWTRKSDRKRPVRKGSAA